MYMHCKACEKSVFKALRKYKGIFSDKKLNNGCKFFFFQSIYMESFIGVEEVRTDREEHKATVTGIIDDPAKILKKLKKKTGKRAEIIGIVDSGAVKEASEENSVRDESSMHNVDHDVDGNVNDGLNENPVINFDMFSEENPNACLIM